MIPLHFSSLLFSFRILNLRAVIQALSLPLLAYGFTVLPVIIPLFACDARELSEDVRSENELNRSFYTF